MEDLSALHHNKLKKMVTDAGGVYTDKGSAIAFLVAAPVVAKVEHKSNSTLDKTRPYGQIFGELEGYPTARFMQNGCVFNTEGMKL